MQVVPLRQCRKTCPVFFSLVFFLSPSSFFMSRISGMSEGGGRVHFIPRLLFLMIQEKEDEFYPSGFFIFQNFKKVFKKSRLLPGNGLKREEKLIY